MEVQKMETHKEVLRQIADNYSTLFRQALQRGCFHSESEVAAALEKGAQAYRVWDSYVEPAPKKPCDCEEAGKSKNVQPN